MESSTRISIAQRPVRTPVPAIQAVKIAIAGARMWRVGAFLRQRMRPNGSRFQRSDTKEEAAANTTRDVKASTAPTRMGTYSEVRDAAPPLADRGPTGRAAS